MFLPGAARLVLARRLVNRCGEASVAASAAPAAGNDEALVGLRKLENFFSGLVVVDDGSDWNFQNYIAAIASGLVRALPVTAALGLVFGIETEMDQGVVALAGFHDDVAALTAVAAGGSAARDKLLAPKGHAAVAAVAGFYADFGFIDEHGRVAGRSSLVVRHSSWIPICQRLATNDSRPKQKPRPEGEAAWRGRPRPRCFGTFEGLLDFHGLNHHELAHRALVQELDAARDFGKESVVFAAAHIQPGLYARAPLPHNDGAAGDDLPAKCLEAKPLRV